jgi:hypothetical protein
MPDRNPHGDDQGTRVGSPDSGDASRRNESRGSTGAGAEAAEAIHSADGGRDPGDRTALEGQPTGRADSDSARAARSGVQTGGNQERMGSEPLTDRETEHRSGYGGAAGEPVRSSDHREPTGPRPSLSETGASNRDVGDTKRTAREQMEEDI